MTVLEEGTFQGPEPRKGASCAETQERSVPGMGTVSTESSGQKVFSTPREPKPPGRAGRPWRTAGLCSERRWPPRAHTRLRPTSPPCPEGSRQPCSQAALTVARCPSPGRCGVRVQRPSVLYSADEGGGSKAKCQEAELQLPWPDLDALTGGPDLVFRVRQHAALCPAPRPQKVRLAVTLCAPGGTRAGPPLAPVQLPGVSRGPRPLQITYPSQWVQR